MEKAKIHVIENDRIIDTLEVMFNPKEYDNDITANWISTETRGGSSLNPQYKGSNLNSFSIKLFFDSYEERADVREDHQTSRFGGVRTVPGTKKIAALGMPTVAGKKTKRPPVCLFSWGKFKFKGVIETIKQKFTMFLSNGIPVRADITITMKPVFIEREKVELMGIEACRKFRFVKEGDRLDIIAKEELKDPSLWRKIAEANNIDDPFNFPGMEDIGRILVIPD